MPASVPWLTACESGSWRTGLPRTQLLSKRETRRRQDMTVELMKTVLQTDTSDPEKVVSAFLKVASVYRDEASVKTAVLDAIDALMKKAFGSSSFNSNTFLTRLLIHMGLLKSEDKIKAIPNLHGPLMVLNHMVKQDYFPKALAPLLLAFVTKPNGALETCSFARHSLLQTLYNI